MANIRIVTTRAPGLIPSLIREAARASNPVVLVPESFTLACEMEFVRRSETQGIFDLKVFSPSSLVREIRELTGYGTRKPVSADAQNMIVSRVLHHHRDQLEYYRDAAGQPTLARKIAGQMNDFTRARLTPDFLQRFQPQSRRTRGKIRDMALVWDSYREALGDAFEDAAGQWMSALERLPQSGILRDAQLLIYGFDYITHDILNLVSAAVDPSSGDRGAAEVIIGLISDDIGPDRDIFRTANDSVRSLEEELRREKIAPFSVQREEAPGLTDPGIAYVEKSIYALGAFPEAKVFSDENGTVVLREDPERTQQSAQEKLFQTAIPDLSHVRTYYAKNSYLECQHACQTLIEWHREGVPWEEMAVAVCEQNTLPSLMSLTLSASGIPFNAKKDQPVLRTAYAQYIYSLLRVLRLNFCRNDVIRMMKTGFSPLTPEEVMEMENYAHGNGIHRDRWLKPFRLPEKEGEKEKVERLEDLRRRMTDPILALRKQLSVKGCTGRSAAGLLFGFISDAGIYDRLLEQEEALAAQGDDLGIDRNRQVWTTVNELLDDVAVFVGEEALPLQDLCTMLEASLAGRMIKSLPQLSRAVTVAPPQMFFSSGIRRMIVMGLQENEISSGGSVLTDHERRELEKYIEEENRRFRMMREAGIPGTEEAERQRRPYSKIGQSLPDLAARQKQDVYQAVSLAREQLMISCSGAKPSGGVLTPSIAFRRLNETVRKRNPENATGGLMNTDIRPFAPAFALEALAIRLRERKDSAEESLRGSLAEDAVWDRALAALYRSETWGKRTEGVLNGLHVTVTAGGLDPEQARRLYQSRGMTISRVETFGSCPWRHLLQYGLDLFPDETFSFQRDEQGTFHHDVLKTFLEEAMKLPEWPDLSERQETALLNRVLKEHVRAWEGGVLQSDVIHRYQGVGIIRGIRTSVASLMRSFRKKPHFLPMAAEVPFGLPDDRSPLQLPPIRIRTEDGGMIAFSGRIDRIDRLETEEGRQYFMIVDNKMSAREVRQNSLIGGLQLQLPLYIRAAQEGLADMEPAGGLYQPIRDVLVQADEPEQIRARIDRELQTSGIILEDPGIQEAMRPVRISRKSDTNDTISAVSPEELQAVTDCAVRVVTEHVNRIRRGETSPAPVRDGQESPCAWCDHADACLYDSTLPGCRIRELDHRHRMEFPSRRS